MVSFTLNGGLLHGRTAHLDLWSSSVRGQSHRFYFWGHFNWEFFVKEGKKKKLEAFLKEFWKLLTRSSAEKKKGIMMTLERLMSLIDTVIHWDTRHISRAQSPPDMWHRALNVNLTYLGKGVSSSSDWHVASFLEREPRVLRERRLFKLRQARGIASSRVSPA